MPEKESKGSTEKENRRKFLKDAGLISVSLAAASLASKGYSQPEIGKQVRDQLEQMPPPRTIQATPKQQIIEKVLLEAMRTRNMRVAVEKLGRYLSSKEKQVLLQLSSADLATLNSIRNKLGAIGAAMEPMGVVVF